MDGASSKQPSTKWLTAGGSAIARPLQKIDTPPNLVAVSIRSSDAEPAGDSRQDS
jgi:hypothetical protein